LVENEASLPVVAELKERGLLLRGSKQEIEEYLKEHSHAFKERSNYIADWRYKFSRQGSLTIKSLTESEFKTTKGWNIQEMREYLASQHN